MMKLNPAIVHHHDLDLFSRAERIEQPMPRAEYSRDPTTAAYRFNRSRVMVMFFMSRSLCRVLYLYLFRSGCIVV